MKNLNNYTFLNELVTKDSAYQLFRFSMTFLPNTTLTKEILKAAKKALSGAAGVYIIINNVTGSVYIGSSMSKYWKSTGRSSSR